jgi:hypothetical protein
MVGSWAGGDDCFCGFAVNPKGGCAAGDELLWFDARYAMWQRDGVALPALATSSPVGTPAADQGVLGLPTTTILAGNETVSDHFRSGYVLEGGYWFDPFSGFAIGLGYFNAGRDSSGIIVTDDDPRIIARPYFDTQTDDQNARVVNRPGEISGVLTVSAFDDFQGAGAWLQKCVWFTGDGCSSTGTRRINLLGGYRYYAQDSLVYIFENSTALTGLEEGARDFSEDKFAGINEFHGAEIGLEARVQRCQWWCEGLAAVAVGPTRRILFVEGRTIAIPPDPDPDDVIPVQQGGLLVSGVTNFGRYTDDEWQAIPRFRLTCGWQFREWAALKLGYNLVVWNIVQAADALPPGLAVDPRNLPIPVPTDGVDPVFPGIRERTMLSHGLDLGLELSF